MDGSAFAACPANYTGLSAGTHTFQVRAVDPLGNVDSSPASYTWTIDLGFPTMSASTPVNNGKVTTGPTQLIVRFSEDVKNDGSAGAANTTANYLLVENGANTTFETLTCSGNVMPDDTQITINSIAYTNNGGNGPFVATLNINGGVALPAGKYRLFVCGTTSIEDLAGNELNNGLSDAIVSFTVAQAGGGGGSGGGSSTTTLPATGFPMNQVTTLPAQPMGQEYASTDLWLEIPRLGVKMTVVGVPQKDGNWDVKWLDKNAGWLNGSAYPTWNGNSVLTGHVWDALNRPGPFAELKKLKYGDQIKIHAFGQVYIYEVRENTAVTPTDTSAVFKHEEKPWLTLVTCEDYKEDSQTYSSRRMVRAVLVSVTADK
jgi:LPXTG-site transpeptidase (sortase) family protein